MDKTMKAVSFLERELALMQDSDFLKTKQLITQKMHQHLHNAEKQIKSFVLSNKTSFPDYILTKSGKISKGENYRDLPYLVLDYPRYFANETIFTFRTMFWWGNFLSCTLHLQGKVLDYYRENLMDNLLKIDDDVYFCVHPTPWEYHYEKSNFLPLKAISEEALIEMLNTKNFVKLSRKLSIAQCADLPQFALKTFEIFHKVIA